MFDYYVKATDAEHLQAVLVEMQLATLHESELVLADGVSLDVIGTYAERIGGTDEEPVYTELDGWYANVRTVNAVEWPEGLNISKPKTPWRVWA